MWFVGHREVSDVLYFNCRWELHSLLHSPGWSLVANPEEMDPNKENQIKIAGSLGKGDEALNGELHEYEVLFSHAAESGH